VDGYDVNSRGCGGDRIMGGSLHAAIDCVCQGQAEG